MSRCRIRLARWTLRGALLFGGVAAAWGLCNAIADDPAQAVERTRPCLVGDLLQVDTTLLADSLICPSYPPPDWFGPGAPDTAGAAAVVDRSRPPAGVRLRVRAPSAERPARTKAPERRAATAPAADPGAGKAVETITPVTRAVVDLTADVVDTSATLVKPVGSPLQPVTEPIVEVLPPLLTPVLDLTQPIIGGPAAPPAAPDDPVVTPAPAADPSTTGMPGAIARPVPPPVSLYPKAASPAARVRTTPDDAASVGTGERLRVPRQQEPGQLPSVTPAASSSTAGSGSASGSAGIAAGASSTSWSPDLRLVGHRARECGALVGVSRQPDTRPA